MPSLSLECFKCSPDENGNQHRLSIDAFSCKKCSKVTTYKAQTFSYNKNSASDERHRLMVIIKFPNFIDTNSERWDLCELRKARMAIDVAEKFNHFVRHISSMKPTAALALSEREVSILLPQRGSLDSTSFVATSFLDRTRKKGDVFVCENDLGRMLEFIDEEGKASPAPKMSRSSPKTKTIKKQRRVQEASFAAGSANSVSRPIPIPSEETSRRHLVKSFNSDSPPSYDESNRIESLRRLRLDSLLSVSSNDDEKNVSWRDQYPAQPEKTVEDYDTVYHRIMSSDFESLHESGMRPNSVGVADSEEDGKDSHPLLQAYIHFFFCQTEGKSIACNLKGLREITKYTLTTPVIHSTQREFGERDGGPRAMGKVIASHKCTWLCRQFPDMTTLLR